jgi:hypothetical protein
MFTSDKDLKKNVKLHGGQQKSDIAERARKERLERQTNRENSNFAKIIQSWWRGRSCTWKWVESQRTLFEKKITDIENLSKVLLNVKNVVFVPPANICVELCKYLLSGCFKEQVTMI